MKVSLITVEMVNRNKTFTDITSKYNIVQYKLYHFMIQFTSFIVQGTASSTDDSIANSPQV